MAGESSSLSEPELAALWRTGARRDWISHTLRAYGPEVLGYLLATLRGEGEATEAFSLFTFELWRASEAYRGECSMRTWCYALARHAVGRMHRERRRQRRAVPLSDSPEVAEVAARVRTETLEYLRTATRDRVAKLREELSPDEQTLLILRVDRRFSWPDIARVMEDQPEVAAPDARKVAALRKRFERIKERLRRRAHEL